MKVSYSCTHLILKCVLAGRVDCNIGTDLGVCDPSSIIHCSKGCSGLHLEFRQIGSIHIDLTLENIQSFTGLGLLAGRVLIYLTLKVSYSCIHLHFEILLADRVGRDRDTDLFVCDPSSIIHCLKIFIGLHLEFCKVGSGRIDLALEAIQSCTGLGLLGGRVLIYLTLEINYS